jgi:hypothetical protein
MSSWTESCSANWLIFHDRAGTLAHVSDRLSMGEDGRARGPAGRGPGMTEPTMDELLTWFSILILAAAVTTLWGSRK